MNRIIVIIGFFFFANTYTATESDYIASVALQADGKIVASGNTVVDGLKQFTLLRVNTDGTIDTTFGTSGFANTTFGTEAEAFSVKIQADGKSVVAGYANILGQPRFALARYNTNGTLDTTFNSTGTVTTALNDASNGYDLALQADGKIVAVGLSIDSGSPHIVVVRYNSDGTLDTTFNSVGFVRTPVETRSGARTVLIQADGKIVVVGRSVDGSTGETHFVVIRYNSDGSLDGTFGSGGIVITQVGSQAVAFSAALQSDGKIVVVGSSDGDFALARYNTDGSIDTTFGASGFVIASVNGNDELHSIAIQSDGKIVAGGISGHFFALGRFNSNGSLDGTFGSGGSIISVLHEEAGANSIVIQADGKIVVGGFDDNRGIVVRFTTAGVADSTFGNNGVFTSPAVAVTLDGEVIFNSFNMTKDAVSAPETKFNDVYTTTGILFPLRVWSLHPSTSTQEPITLSFHIPKDYDTILPVELHTHLLIDNKGASGVGNAAALLVQGDFKSNNQEFGAGAGGAELSTTSNSFTFTQPSGNNLKHVNVIIPLRNNNIFPGDFGFLAFTRSAPTGTQYSADIYLNSIAFRYKKFIQS